MSTEWKYRPCVDCEELVMSGKENPRCLRHRKAYALNRNFINKWKKCSIPKCDKDAYVKGLCEKHYKRWIKFGSPYLTIWKIRYMQRENGIYV